MNIYRDGSLLTKSSTAVGTYNYIPNTSKKLKVGFNEYGTRYLDGSIDEVGMWDVELDAANVSAIYNSGAPMNIKSDSGNYDEAANCISYWKMGDGNNDDISTIEDQIGLGDLTPTNMESSDIQTVSAPTTFTNTKSILFDGVDEYLDVSDHNDFTPTSSGFSIVFWVKFSDATSSTIISKGWPGLASNSGEWTVDTTAGNKMKFFAGYGSSGWSTATYDTSIAGDEGEWHHWAVTYDGGGNVSGVSMYRDGSSLTLSTTNSTITDTNTTMPVDIGTVNFANIFNTNYMDGNLDEIAVYKTELSSANITKIYDSGVPFDLRRNQGNYNSSIDLVGYWRMGDDTSDSNTTIYDQTGNNHDATGNNLESGDLEEDTP